MEETFEQNMWQESLKEILKKEDGRYVIYFILLRLGFFSDIFVSDINIYKNAALADTAKWLERELDSVDLQTLPRIKLVHQYLAQRLENYNK